MTDEGTVVANTADAVALLLHECPELTPLWLESAAVFGPDPEEVGIYGVFGQLVLPLLHTLLTGQPSDELNGLLPAGEVEREALTQKGSYRVIDLWASAADANDTRRSSFLK